MTVGKSISREEHWTRLMTLAQAGDTQAYQKLLRDLCIYVKAIVRAHLSDPMHTDELSRDILRHIHKARRTFDSTRRFIPWLHAICEYRLLDYYRDHYASEALEKVDLNSDYVEAYSDSWHRDEVDGTILQALLALPEKQRRSVEALKVKGLRVEDAAKDAGMSVASLKKQAFQAFKTLRAPSAERAVNHA